MQRQEPGLVDEEDGPSSAHDAVASSGFPLTVPYLLSSLLALRFHVHSPSEIGSATLASKLLLAGR